MGGKQGVILSMKWFQTKCTPDSFYPIRSSAANQRGDDTCGQFTTNTAPLPALVLEHAEREKLHLAFATFRKYPVFSLL